MASHTPPKLSIGEVLHLFFVSLPLAMGVYFYEFIRHALVAWSDDRFNSMTLKRNLATCAGSLLTVFSLREMQFIQRQTTGDAVRAYAKTNKLALRSEPLADADTDGFAPATLHLLDLPSGSKERKGAPTTLLYFHGGAFVSPLGNPGPAHIIARRMGARQLAVLEYGLAPACRYPTQLAQAVAALRHLVIVDNIGFHDIAIAGDSAGGNLSLALLAHMQKPHPRISPLPVQESRLRGVLAISARTRNEPTRASHDENAGKDMLSKASMALIAEAWRPIQGEVWAAPDVGDRAFWQGLCADHVLLVAGGNEIYRDDIVHTAEMMGAGEVEEDAKKKGREPVVEVVVCPGEVHAQSVVDLVMGIEGGIMAGAVLRWADKVGRSS